ncbi:CusA/CzcA family heavy metal efflux RND transporter [Chitinophaga pendula]|uniref:CusA/CzcA family heavy metal efflux RND transporter n=1 Tax=Chitinophaga TaxID=79328 RepID=UPI000BAE9EC1|nr:MULTISPECIES: CusA/CzcA family heavy metal efflux RND transporter [Chitinophaga]ASZ12856.1 CusA/CzcA family heavy metal efflux RND transporter [Chitinophaga sp. MD30]UCJ09517.1 CusA/CzcA family heavy metal efflux RND transporter [Chitinophaga pendula]
MLDKIIRFSIQRKLIVGILTLGLVIWGIFSLTKLPVDAVPDITNNQVQVITLSPSLAAQEVERLITFPVEQTMAVIPEITEIRSISRFGISVVTIVFHDDVNIYWARQQVNEKLSEAKNNIPPDVGSPEMAPISSGLGEIYQYVVHPKKGFEKKFDARQLRTIQDWYVRRQLLGTPGIAEVNSFGGLLKQYVVALNPDKLRSYNLSITDVFNALEKNNENAGGAYIDKKPNAWFIRSEGLISNIDDIGNIVVKNTGEGIPILIKSIANVEIGEAVRYGALTRNADGEAVGGIVMMLKGENSNQVVKRVKTRIAEIQKTLPEGVVIEPFLDRSDFVGRAVGTVQKNLIEGALIVIFVLVLFLGNLRAGLIVASVIPLAMLFAITMMNLFGVSGNLMSLGAIDFGLIVDGAVIIVEATMHHLLTGRTTQVTLTQSQMDEEVYDSARKIRSTAAFGEIIILIVYLPIMALVGIEGKMFKPMAQTVSFAILGAFILSLTYVPMMSALFLNKKINPKRTIADKMMDFFHRIYDPMIRAALRVKAWVVIAAVALFVIALLIFNRMGAEFIPTLEEGDLAVQTVLLTGSSLTETIDKVNKASDILLKQFPEVKEVIGKIGSAEIPTDPMPMDNCDLTILLKPKKEWTSAKSREELVNKMQDALEAIPGVSFGFSQPIQLRFNELISGVRQDVGIKIFGEDLETLASLAGKVGNIVAAVDGAKDLYVERVGGLQQIVVKINRARVAQYGLDISTINKAINAAFAGQSAGLVYEGEKRFDLVVRLDQQSRQGIADVQNLFITTPTGNQVPLQQLATVEMAIGPNQIQREDTKRRIIVGFNVRGRDIASVVREIQQKIEQQVNLPDGYFIRYGGQFENLKEANARLSIAVPVALLLIFALLYFTFSSVKQSVLIFTAIPMAAIGGVFALLIRGMPFSISAGVGFIALFGVAVLNGIVLIGEFNRLRKEGLSDLNEIVLKGTAVRLRPVLMTACVASLGFLPMALATSAGGEVQRPLATVVIGGLITSTLLTLLVLPCLYIYFESIKRSKVKKNITVAVILLFLIPATAFSQDKPLTMEEAVQTALQQNKGLKAAASQVDYYRYLTRTSGEVTKTELALQYGQYNSYAKNDNNFSITQAIPFPTVFGARKALTTAQTNAAEWQRARSQHELIYQVRQAYVQLLYLQGVKDLLVKQDSLFSNFSRSADLRYRTGETRMLEKVAAEARLNEVRNQLKQNEADSRIYMAQLQSLLATDKPLSLAASEKLETDRPAIADTSGLDQHPYLQYLKQEVTVAQQQQKLAKANILPDITVGYFNQTLIGTAVNSSPNSPLATGSNRFQGFQVGLALPIWAGPLTAKVKAQQKQEEVNTLNYEHNRIMMEGQLKQAVQQYIKQQNNIAYYHNTALPNAELILKQSEKAYASGEIGYTEHFVNLEQVLGIRQGYLQTAHDTRQAALYIDFLAGYKK